MGLSSILGALLIFIFIHSSHSQEVQQQQEFFSKLPPSQIHSLLHLQKLLEYPPALSQLQHTNTSTNFCSLQPSPSFNISCNSTSSVGTSTIVSIHILGRNSKPLSANFSMETLGNILSSFPDLEAISLVSLGLWGSLPPKLDHLPQLHVLDLSGNFISGALPDRLASLEHLSSLKLDNNRFTGPLPAWLGDLSGLTDLIISHNNFTGDLPRSLFTTNKVLRYLNAGANHLGPAFPPIQSAPQLQEVLLGQNDITGGIPRGVSASHPALRVLDLSYNSLRGVPPVGLLHLAGIQTLALNGNQLRGVFPVNLTLAPSLRLLDLSSNLFTGPVPTVFLNGTAVVRFGKNCLVTRVQPQYRAAHCSVTRGTGGPDSHDVAIIAGIIGGGVAMMAAVGVFVCVLVRCLKQQKDNKDSKQVQQQSSCADSASVGVPSDLLSNARYLSQSIRMGVHSASHNRVFSVPELEEATANFSASKMIGEGQHGKVFKGKLPDGTVVAVKCLTLDSRQDLRQLKIHVELLVKIRHRHLVGYIGYSLDREPESGSQNRRLFLVSEYVDNGTLRNHLSKTEGKEQLTWPQRLAAVIGAGRGIQYLHTGVVPGIFNNDVNIINILMDQNCVAKFTDFGLGRHARTSCDFDQNKVFVQKAAAHIDLDHHRRKLASDKTDVYNFGFILLEVILGRPPTIDDSKSVHPRVRELEMLQTEHVPRYEVVDTSIVGTCVAESLTTVLEIAAKCLSEDLSTRPSMEDVLWNLQYAAQVQDRVSGEYSEELPYVSPPRSRFNRQAIRTSSITGRRNETGR